MAASIVARKQLARVLPSSSLRSTRSSTPLAASRSYNKHAVEDLVDDHFYVECGPGPEGLKPGGCAPLHHEYLVRNLRDGYHVKLYMAGVGKGNVKVSIVANELIVEGIKEKDYEYEDDEQTNTLFRYRMFGPNDEHFNLDEIRAEINNGMLKVFAPRRDPNNFNPKKG